MSFLIASAMKDLARWARDRGAILIWLGIPFLIGGMITLMMGGGGVSPTGILLIADEDDSLASGFVAGAYSQEQLGELITVEKVTREEGEARINDGEASGFLIIPKGFQDAFLDETPVTLTLKTNPAQTILPGIIEDVTEILLDGGFYLQRLLGPEIRTIRNSDFEGNPSDAFVSGISVDIQHKMNMIREKTDPLAIIDHGKIIAQGNVDELKSQLNTRDALQLTGQFPLEATKAVVEALAGEIGDLELLSQAEDSLLLTLPNASQHLPRIFAAISSAGGNVVETSLRSPNLETLFLLLTGKELRQ